MKKDLFKRYSLALFGSVLVATFTATGAFSFAWFTNNNNITRDFSGETKGAYFASGDGSSEKPFIINKPIHLYNLSWLQYLGFFNEDKKDADGNTGKDGAIDKQYYFKISADLDMNGWILPPIGTKTNPFVGNFDGGNYTISNLTISNKIGTDAGNITKHPGVVTETHFNSEDNPNIIGFFGVIGSVGTYSLTFSSDINAVSNFYLDGVKIYTYNSNVLCGMLAGYVNGTLTNAGVHYGNMNIASGTQNISDFTNVSSYSLIGDYNKEKYSWDDDPDGGDVGYGTSTDIRALYDEMSRLNLMDKTTGVISSGTALPFKCSDDSALSGGEGSKTITTYGRSLTINYSKSISVADGATNIGYYSGPEIKTYKDYFAKTKASDDYEVDYENIKVADLSSIKTVDESIKNYLTTDIDELTRKGDSALVLSGTNFLDTSSLGVKGGYNLIKNAKVGDYEGELLIPYRSIWVAPIQPGKFQMVIVNKDTQSARLAVWKVQRNTPKDYSTGFVNTYYDSTVVGVVIPSYSGSGAYTPYYYGVEVTQDDIDNGYEFVITKYLNGSNVYITYIDVGANGGSDEDDRTILTGFDFVEKDSNDSIIKITDDSYTKSKVSFKISNTTVGVASTSAYSYYFRRTGETTVLYYFTPTSGGGLSFTVLGTSANAKEGSSSDLDDTTTSA